LQQARARLDAPSLTLPRKRGRTAMGERPLWRVACRAVYRSAPGRSRLRYFQGWGPNSGCLARMVKITFIDSTGKSRTIDAEPGSTVMETAIKHGVPGIEAECGGACACATCHVYVDEAWREKVGPPSPMEEDMLDFGYDVRANSRLSCQIKVIDALDGLVVSTPERQA
jgi:2Fe-2S ferredoxin